MHLVLIETAGNQQYIFASNRLRENVGASELTYRAGTKYVLEAVAEAGGPRLWSDDQEEVRAGLLHDKRNPPLADGQDGIEVVLAASGKAMLLASDAGRARRIISRVTRRALEEAPGLDVRGFVSDSFELGSHELHRVVQDAHRGLEGLRGMLPGPQERFLRLPVVEPCATSGLPASELVRVPNESSSEACSLVSYSKRRAAEEGLSRMRQAAGGHRLPYSADALEHELECAWLAVVHADGNGLGEVFLNFERYVRASAEGDQQARNRAYVDTLRRFSLALDRCTERAFCSALAKMMPTRKQRQASKNGAQPVLPILPLVLGGDDLTVLCDGEQALPFTHQFLERFCELADDGEIQEVLSCGQPGARLTASAGVAIIKPHDPFFTAYDLAEALLRNAKRAKPAAAIDCHVVFDASGPDLNRVRRQLRVDGGRTVLTARPYVLGKADGRYANRRVADLVGWIQVLRRDGGNGESIPRSVLHDLRHSLFLGHQQADARFKLLLPRHGALRSLAHGSGDSVSLFWREEESGDAPDALCYTGLLDALELAPFWRNV
jgi:hypothetical protein